MPYFKDKKYCEYLVGQIIPVLEKDGFLASYKIQNIIRRGNSMSDYALWDDAKDYKLKLYSVTPFVQSTMGSKR